jgi:hypothetical protein
VSKRELGSANTVAAEGDTFADRRSLSARQLSLETQFYSVGWPAAP